MKNRLTIQATDTNIIYLKTNTITHYQWVPTSLEFTIYTTTSLSIVFTLVEGFHEDAITKILEQVNRDTGELSTKTITRTAIAFTMGDNTWKALRAEHTDEDLQTLEDDRIKYAYDISAIRFGGVEIGILWELNADGDLTPLA